MEIVVGRYERKRGARNISLKITRTTSPHIYHLQHLALSFLLFFMRETTLSKVNVKCSRHPESVSCLVISGFRMSETCP